MQNPRTILITGATSGIGWALATAYAASGITLFLHGRNRERLNEVMQLCKNKGAEVYGKTVDVVEREQMRKWIESCDQKCQLDMRVLLAQLL